jgi:hypothetical protein
LWIGHSLEGAAYLPVEVRTSCRRWNAGEEGHADVEIVSEESTGEEPSSTLDEICREGARRMLAAALELEADGYLAGPSNRVHCVRG